MEELNPHGPLRQHPFVDLSTSYGGTEPKLAGSDADRNRLSTSYGGTEPAPVSGGSSSRLFLPPMEELNAIASARKDRF